LLLLNFSTPLFKSILVFGHDCPSRL
jgi:hypothetical protein